MPQSSNYPGPAAISALTDSSLVASINTRTSQMTRPTTSRRITAVLAKGPVRGCHQPLLSSSLRVIPGRGQHKLLGVDASHGDGMEFLMGLSSLLIAMTGPCHGWNVKINWADGNQNGPRNESWAGRFRLTGLIMIRWRPENQNLQLLDYSISAPDFCDQEAKIYTHCSTPREQIACACSSLFPSASKQPFLFNKNRHDALETHYFGLNGKFEKDTGIGKK